MAALARGRDALRKVEFGWLQLGRPAAALSTRRQCYATNAKTAVPSKRYATTDQLSERMKDTAETLIIGGGCLGCGLVYHLAKAGMKDVVLLEKTELTAGSTWHAAGLSTFYSGIVNMKKIQHESIKLFQTLEKETGQQVGFHGPGTIRLAKTPQRVDEFRYQIQRHGWYSDIINQSIITPDEIKKLHPLIDTDQILAGLYMQGDGHIDPYSLTQAYAAGARKYGAEIYQRQPVLGLKQCSDGTWEVETKHGIIKANRVVNATGLWSHEFSKLHGNQLPVMTVQHQYIVTTTVPEIQARSTELPVLRDMDDSYYVRQERSGLLIGPYEAEHKMKQQKHWVEGVPPGFGRELFESDLDRIDNHLEAAMSLMPVLKSADIQTVVCGPIAFTPDSMGLVGPYPGLKNYWCLCAAAGGIIWSGGLGKYLTHWIMTGEQPHDLIELDPVRYGKWTSMDYVEAKTRETYGMYNHIVYANDERFAGRPTERISGAYGKMKERGAQFVHNTGWEQPGWFALSGDEAGYKPSFRRTNWFEPVGRECRMVTEKAGVIDLSSVGKFEVRGKDASKIMEYLCARSMPEVGKSVVAHMLTSRGTVHSELTICKLNDVRYFCITGAASELFDIRWIETHADKGGFDVSVLNVSDDGGCLSIAGPKSREILQKLTTTDVSDAALLPMDNVTMDIAGVEVLVIRGSSTGELGYEFYHDKKDTLKLYEALLEAGEPYGMGDFGSYALNSMRIERGYRRWGNDMTIDYDPYETGLGQYIDLNKSADFIGKEALLKLKEKGTNRKLALLSIATDNVDSAKYDTVWCDNKVAGYVTSGTYSYSTNQIIAYANLPLNLASVGSKVEVELLGKHYPATVIEEPIIKEKSARL
ncbi:dimethylglycine dehydrogenase, mitochondrial-like [Saccoglossus kowalevskii]|uniref:Dimethylglycine dehydrogenase, mitochondrial-like n=1 Tax=Saccoglossus kowalevskii TaxID=10224 RepID=A0ABM0GU43_SACKO|nr:PREDICTED: dimethylglycine dehydrogenase, mitochondrial-like [Saccoglossus kowalevskii]